MEQAGKVLFTTAYIRDRHDLYNWMQSNVPYRSSVVYRSLAQPVLFDGFESKK